MSKIQTLPNSAPAPGDVIYVNRGAYKHYGVYAGEGKVVHFAPLEGAEISAENAVIHETTMAGFLKGGELVVDTRDKSGFPREEIVRRARSQTGSKGYSLAFYNCEHFARWCKTGKIESQQVEAAAEIAVRGISYGIDLLRGEANEKDGKLLRKKLQQFFE
jgi:hypothetical protein